MGTHSATATVTVFHRVVSSSATCLAALILTSCSDNGAGSGRGIVVVGTADGLFPADSLTDWVSYAVQISSVTVLNEREISPPASVYENGEGYIGRTVTLAVGKTFWMSPSGGAAPTEIDITVAGWVLQGGRRAFFALERSPRLEVGGQYTIPLVIAPSATGESQWAPLSTESLLERPGDLVATQDVHARGHSAVAQSLSGIGDVELQRTFMNTAPDPVAAMHWDLAPYDRWLAVSAAK
jgi:hypothetical protein